MMQVHCTGHTPLQEMMLVGGNDSIYLYVCPLCLMSITVTNFLSLTTSRKLVPTDKLPISHN